MPAHQPLPQSLRRLIGATLPDGRVVDVEMEDDVVTAVVPATPGAVAADGELDLTGYLLLTAPAEPHAHLDKALSWDEISPPMGDLGLAIDSWRAHSRGMTTEGIAARATAALRMMLQAGTTAVRTHVDLLSGPQPLRGVQALTGLREEVRHLIDLQIVALAAPDTPDATVHAALDLGVDLIGGAPHLAPDPVRDLDRLLTIAQERGVGADIHTDESLHGEPTLTHYAQTVRDWPADRVRSAGHCVRQGTQSAADLVPVIEAVLAAGIGVISLPITNLYLQGWEHPASTPRGLTALRAFLDAGVPVAGGADNLRDPFNPVGRGDALETASLLVTAGHLTLDEAYQAVCSSARSVLGLPPAGAEPGHIADFLAVQGASLGEVIAAAPAQRRVIHRGALVARSSVVHDSAF
ncbi:amidohydrolase family protein [Kineosporia sp. NBRC 101731]|uniref:amidohydrolase family protein n=1 Tax=Kineosporia sp. NBRC 101731 TaxID=3032199 RepID=UPI002553EF0E|nr:amidohydrolase family protein [Kineosporia sp. NBRC 101731]